MFSPRYFKGIPSKVGRKVFAMKKCIIKKALRIKLGGQNSSLRSDAYDDRDMEAKLAEFKELFWTNF